MAAWTRSVYDPALAISTHTVEARLLQADGTPTGTTFTIASTTTTGFYELQLAGTGDGGFVAVWTSN